MSDSNSSKQPANSGFGRRSRMVFPTEKLSKEEVKINIKRIISLLMPYKIRLILLVVFILGSTAATIVAPIFIGKIIDKGIVQRNPGELIKYLSFLAMI